MRDVFFDVRFQKCQRGYLLDAGGVNGLMGSLYAFDNIEGVAAWFIERFSDDAKAIEAGTAKTEGLGPEDESAVAQRFAQKDRP